jgi:phosphatidylinositol alpha-1,6-mannosyltransferase
LVWAGIYREAGRAIRLRRPDLIHAGQILETGLAALLFRRKYGIPYVVHTYGEEINYYARWELTRGWMRAVLREAAAVTTISNYTAERIRRLELFAGPISLLYPGATLSRFTGTSGQAVRERYGLGDAPVLLTVARLLPRKGHDRVLDALPQIRAQVPGVRYLVVGSGMTETYLRDLVKRKNLDDAVVFTGPVPHSQIPDCFAAADLFIHPNRETADGDVEGFGIVFLEAGASGVPVIGGNSGGTPDAIRDGETGYLVDPNNVAEIAERTVRLLTDPELRRRMGEGGRAWAARFTWDAAAARVRELSAAAIVGQGPGAGAVDAGSSRQEQARC